MTSRAASWLDVGFASLNTPQFCDVTLADLFENETRTTPLTTCCILTSPQLNVAISPQMHAHVEHEHLPDGARHHGRALPYLCRHHESEPLRRRQGARVLHQVQVREEERAGQGRAGQGRAAQGRAAQGRAGQGRAGQGRAGQGQGARALAWTGQGQGHSQGQNQGQGRGSLRAAG